MCVVSKSRTDSKAAVPFAQSSFNHTQTLDRCLTHWHTPTSNRMTKPEVPQHMISHRHILIVAVFPCSTLRPLPFVYCASCLHVPCCGTYTVLLSIIILAGNIIGTMVLHTTQQGYCSEGCVSVCQYTQNCPPKDLCHPNKMTVKVGGCYTEENGKECLCNPF